MKFAKLDDWDQQLDRYEKIEVYAVGATNVFCEILWTARTY